MSLGNASAPCCLAPRWAVRRGQLQTLRERCAARNYRLDDLHAAMKDPQFGIAEARGPLVRLLGFVQQPLEKQVYTDQEQHQEDVVDFSVCRWRSLRRLYLLPLPGQSAWVASALGVHSTGAVAACEAAEVSSCAPGAAGPGAVVELDDDIAAWTAGPDEPPVDVDAILINEVLDVIGFLHPAAAPTSAVAWKACAKVEVVAFSRRSRAAHLHPLAPCLCPVASLSDALARVGAVGAAEGAETEHRRKATAAAGAGEETGGGAGVGEARGGGTEPSATAERGGVVCCHFVAKILSEFPSAERLDDCDSSPGVDSSPPSSSEVAGQRVLVLIARVLAGGPCVSVSALRAALVHFIASGGLHGDGLAAEFFLMALGGCRLPSAAACVGRVSVNIHGQAPTRPKPVYPDAQQVLATSRALLPYVIGLPVAVRGLNSSSLCPAVEFVEDDLSPGDASEVLRSGALQVPNNWSVVLDETALESGVLTEKGTSNVKMLQTALSAGQVPYSYSVSEHLVKADWNVLVLSRSCSIFKPCLSLQVPLVPKTTPSAEAGGAALTPGQDEPKEELLQQFRLFLAFLLTDEAPLLIAPEVKKTIADDFVKLRQQDASISSDDFSSWLAMARVFCLSHGEPALSIPRW
eukprot:GHVT01027955.1.p1 GENE.GHVT01027955.1~~GHVT01027955.1.p1  ORF type:complete len:635 (+),score=177.51 GHVT01027955.1:336-2240(+)